MIGAWLQSPTVDFQPLSGISSEMLLLVPALGLIAAAWRAQFRCFAALWANGASGNCCGGSASRWRTTCCCRARTGRAGPSSIIWCGCPTAFWCWRPNAWVGAWPGGRASEPGRNGSAVPFRFLNPLWQNALHVEAVRALAGPAVRVEGMVVLVGRLVQGRAARRLLPAGGPAPATDRAGHLDVRRRAAAATPGHGLEEHPRCRVAAMARPPPSRGRDRGGAWSARAD